MKDEGGGDGALEVGMARSAMDVVNTPDTPDFGITGIDVKDEDGTILTATSNHPSFHVTPIATANETPNASSTDVTAVNAVEVVEG